MSQDYNHYKKFVIIACMDNVEMVNPVNATKSPQVLAA